jgi:hypothetical protein
LLEQMIDRLIAEESNIADHALEHRRHFFSVDDVAFVEVGAIEDTSEPQ